MNKKILSKRGFLNIVNKYEEGKKLTPSEVKSVGEFSYKKKSSKVWTLVKKSTLPISLLFGALITIFPERAEDLADKLPQWTNLSDKLVLGLDYLWNIIGEPVGKSNIVYHLPNVILYAFGFIGLKALFDAINKVHWQDKVLKVQKNLEEDIKAGKIKLFLKNGFSILFVGNGDFIGEEFDKSQPEDMSITISAKKPIYTNIWEYFDVSSDYSTLPNVLSNLDFENAGEYVFFPVKDDQIFLPSLESYDLSAHKIELIIRSIRLIEKEKSITPKRIIITGDKFQKSTIYSEDHMGKIKDSEEIVSLLSISKKYENVVIIDPSEIVLKKIMAEAKNKKIVFRASNDGMLEYKNRFYYRLGLVGYDSKNVSTEELVIGYDLFEDQVEHQSLNKTAPHYYPVVLSRSVYEALIKNGYKQEEFIYVPKIVLESLKALASSQ